MTKFYKAIPFFPALSVRSKVGNTTSLWRAAGLPRFTYFIFNSAGNPRESFIDIAMYVYVVVLCIGC